MLPAPPNSSGSVERIEPPGAPRSGLTVKSAAGPYEEKAEMRFAVGCGSLKMDDVQVSMTLPAAMRASRRAPSAAVMETTGIVIAVGFATEMSTRPAALL